MKKRAFICIAIVLALCISLFAACSTSFDDDALVTAISNLERELLSTKETPESYQLDSKIDSYDSKGNPASIYIKWTIEGTNLITISEGDGFVTVNIPEIRPNDISYTICATLVNEKGQNYTNDGKAFSASVSRVAPAGESAPGGGENPGGGGTTPGGGSTTPGGGENPGGGGSQGGETPGGGENPGGGGTTPGSGSQGGGETPGDDGDGVLSTNWSAHYGTYDLIGYDLTSLEDLPNDTAQIVISASGIVITRNSEAPVTIAAAELEYYVGAIDDYGDSLDYFYFTYKNVECIIVIYTDGYTEFYDFNDEFGYYTENGPTSGGGTTPGGGGETNPGGEITPDTGRTVTIDFTAQGYISGAVVDSNQTINGIGIVFEKGSNSSTAATYYEKDDGNHLRVYADNAMTITAKNITKIVFTFAKEYEDNSNPITPSVGSFNIDTWTGSADSVTFRIGQNSEGWHGHRKIVSLTITLGQGGGTTPGGGGSQGGGGTTPGGDTTGKGTLASPYTVADALEVINNLPQGERAASPSYVEGKITGSITTGDSGDLKFVITDTGSGDGITIWYATAVECKEGDTVVVYGYLWHFYNSQKGTVTPEMDNNGGNGELTIVSVNGQSTSGGGTTPGGGGTQGGGETDPGVEDYGTPSTNWSAHYGTYDLTGYDLTSLEDLPNDTAKIVISASGIVITRNSESPVTIAAADLEYYVGATDDYGDSLDYFYFTYKNVECNIVIYSDGYTEFYDFNDEFGYYTEDGSTSGGGGTTPGGGSQGGGETTPGEAIPNGNGTKNSPYNASGANAAFANLSDGSYSSAAVYVKGYVVAQNDYNGKATPFKGIEGDWRLYIADTANGTSTFFVNYAAEASDKTIKVGDIVVVYGYVENYKGIQMYKNGSTKPQIIEIISGGTTSGGGEETNPGGSGSNPGGETNPGAYTFDFVGKYGTYSASWSGTVGSYAERTVSATDLGMQATVEFVFSYASKQASDATIGDRPVLASKGGATEYVTVTATGSTISSVTFNLKEWVTGGTGAPKTFKKLQIEYKTSSGEWTVVNGVGFDGTAQQITDYTTLTATNLPADVTQVRLVYVGGGEKNQQIGLTSIELTFA